MSKWFASAQYVPARKRDSITEGKRYEIEFDESIPFVHSTFGRGFLFIDDENKRRYACEFCSSHLDDGDWTITEESDGQE